MYSSLTSLNESTWKLSKFYRRYIEINLFSLSILALSHSMAMSMKSENMARELARSEGCGSSQPDDESVFWMATAVLYFSPLFQMSICSLACFFINWLSIRDEGKGETMYGSSEYGGYRLLNETRSIIERSVKTEDQRIRLGPTMDHCQGLVRLFCAAMVWILCSYVRFKCKKCTIVSSSNKIYVFFKYYLVCHLYQISTDTMVRILAHSIRSQPLLFMVCIKFPTGIALIRGILVRKRIGRPSYSCIRKYQWRNQEDFSESHVPLPLP